MITRGMKWMILMITLVSLLLPPTLYWFVIGRIPSVTAEQALEILSRQEASVLLVDVRPAEEFTSSHIDGAVNWPGEKILSLTSIAVLPESLINHRLLLICDSGMVSALAVQKLQNLGFNHARNVTSGMQAWVALDQKSGKCSYCRLRTAAGEIKKFPFRTSTPTEQYAAIISGFWVKPAYMLLSVILALFLFRRQETDLTALKWALLAFFFGEAFCALNYLTAADKSYLLEYLHSFGMTAAVALATYAFFEGMDRRIIRLSHPEERCAALALCPRCIKHTDAPCGLRRFFYVIILALTVLALLLLMVPTHPVSYNTSIFGVAYNWSHPVIHQLYEIRFCPLAGGVLLASALLVLLLKKNHPVGWSKIIFAAGMGPLFFGYFRLMLFAPFRENLVWFSFWEEITELLAVAAVGFILWIFRHRLFYRESKEAE